MNDEICTRTEQLYRTGASYNLFLENGLFKCKAILDEWSTFFEGSVISVIEYENRIVLVTACFTRFSFRLKLWNSSEMVSFLSICIYCFRDAANSIQKLPCNVKNSRVLFDASVFILCHALS